MLNETSKHTPSTSNKYTLAMKVIELGKVSDIFYFDFFDSFDSKFNSKEANGNLESFSVTCHRKRF